MPKEVAGFPVRRRRVRLAHMTNPLRFIHLRVHTEHSLLEGAVPVKKLVKLVAAAAMPAVAVTDTNNMFAALEFSVTAKDAGVQPIVGCQVSVAYDPAGPGEKLRLPAPVVLLAQDETGYMNLMKLNSCLYIDKGGQLNQVTLEELAQYSAGLICLTGGAEGPLGRFVQAGQSPRARELVERFATIYGDRLYMELQRHPGEGGRLPAGEAATERWFVETAYELGLRVPDELSVVGFDDSTLACRLSPPLTTIRQPTVELAARVTEALIRRINGDGEDEEQIEMATSLVIRGSAAERRNV